MKLIVGLLLAALTFVGVRASACSSMGLILAQPAPYFQTGGTMKDTFNVTVFGNTTQGACNYFLTFDYGSSNSYTNRSVKKGSDVWPYQISADNAGLQILKKFPDVNSCSDVICDKLQGNTFYNTKTSSYTVAFNTANDWRSAGTYLDTVTVRLYQGNISNYTLVASQAFLLTFGSPKKADLSVVSSGGAFDLSKTTHTINFGNNLTTGAQGTADLIVKYNSGYNLYAWSDNGGKLKQVNGTDTIDYTFKINGTTYAIPWWTQIATQTGTSPASGLVNPVTIIIGNTSGKAQGSYSDTINLTIQSSQ